MKCEFYGCDEPVINEYYKVCAKHLKFMEDVDTAMGLIEYNLTMDSH